jgi:hypothetical protein
MHDQLRSTVPNAWGLSALVGRRPAAAPCAEKLFLRSYVFVARPPTEVEAQMAAGAQNWLPEMAVEANGNGVKLLSELGFDLGRRRIGRRIKVEIGAPKVSSGIMFMPIRWGAASEAGIFPTLDGELEVSALGSSRTHLGLSATYEPPLGLIGKLADRALFHRVAEVTVHDFLMRIGARLETGPAGSQNT